MMNNQLVIMGAGGHAKVCYEVAVKMNQWDQIIVLDDNPENDFFDISGKLDTYSDYIDAEIFVAIGNNDFREKIFDELLESGYKIATLIDPSAVISRTAKIEEGTIVMPGVVINANSEVGKGVILNTSCTVDHDCRIDNYVHISPGANLAGNVFVGANSWIGIGATVIQGVKITENCLIGAGSVVIEEIKETGIFFGVPIEKR